MAFGYQELNEFAGLASDGVAGFEAQIALKSYNIEAVWPEHFQGNRIDSFREGSAIARDWQLARSAVGRARRKIRSRESERTGGMMPVLKASTPAELREEQIETLKEVVARRAASRAPAADDEKPPDAASAGPSI